MWLWRCGSPARLVRCRNPAATRPLTSIWVTPLRPSRGRLAVAERGGNRHVVRLPHRDGRGGIAEPSQQGHGLGGTKAQIETNKGPSSETTHLLAGGGVEAGPHSVEIGCVDFAVEAKRDRRGSRPTAGCLSDDTVVLVDTVGDRGHSRR